MYLTNASHDVQMKFRRVSSRIPNNNNTLTHGETAKLSQLRASAFATRRLLVLILPLPASDLIQERSVRVLCLSSLPYFDKVNAYYGHFTIHKRDRCSLRASSIPHAIHNHHPQDLALLLRRLREKQCQSGLAN